MIKIGDCRQILKEMPEKSINCCVTSPPYFGLRDYGNPGQIGLEPTPSEFVLQLVDVFREVKRVLRDDGTLWLNLGDSYAGSPGGYQGKNGDRRSRTFTAKSKHIKRGDGLKPKDLIGIPWRVAFALQEDGWYLRQDIIWSKPNPMPESVTDRCTKSHEYIFLLSKSPKYYFDAAAIREPMAASSIGRLAQDLENQKGGDRVPGKTNGKMKAVAKGNAKTFRGGVYTKGAAFENATSMERDSHGNSPNESGLRNKRSVWNVSTRGFTGAHFATFPLELIEPCIKAGCPAGGTVLDPFLGAGTTGIVAHNLQREWIGIEINPEYAEMALRRTARLI